jgi:hypothetical protein
VTPYFASFASGANHHVISSSSTDTSSAFGASPAALLSGTAALHAAAELSAAHDVKYLIALSLETAEAI